MSDNLKTDIKKALVRSLRLPIQPEEIQDDLRLFEEGLGLDSIDALELVLEVERTFGVVIDSEQTGLDAFKSVNTLAEFIETHRTAKR